jgi:hypothetical protein
MDTSPSRDISLKCHNIVEISEHLEDSVSFDIKPCGLLKVNRCFRGLHLLQLQGRRMCKARWWHQVVGSACYHTSMRRLFLRRVCWLPTYWVVLYFRRHKSPPPPLWKPHILNLEHLYFIFTPLKEIIFLLLKSSQLSRPNGVTCKWMSVMTDFINTAIEIQSREKKCL